jgi:hypothetical protein
MCISQKDPFPIKHQIGYKIVQTDGEGTYLSWDYIPKAGKVQYLTNGMWQVDTNLGKGPNDGFHILLGKPHIYGTYYEARMPFRLVVVKFEFKDIVSYGAEYNYDQKTTFKAVVAKSIRFIKEVK